MRKRFGLSVIVVLITLSAWSGSALAAVYEADYTPWSGYWWPFTQGGLVTGSDYRGRPAPLEKFDLAIAGTSSGPATAFGRRFYYDPDALHWEGMCFCWSAAAILEPEPRYSGIYNDVYFRIGDKKGILTSAYDGVLYNYYGLGDPVDFHEILDDFIRRQRRPVIMDLGTDGEIWNYPVFRYETTYTTAGSRRHYTTTIYYASDAVLPDFQGTLVSSSTFYYYFELDAQGFIVDSGWEGSSIAEPPIRASDPYGTTPLNTGMTYQDAVAIAQADDDPFENNDLDAAAAVLESGRYGLIGLDEDFFKVSLEQGDQLRVSLAVYGSQVANWRVWNPNGELLADRVDNGDLVAAADQDGDFLIQVTPYTPEEQPYYELEVQQRLTHRYFLPLDKSGSWVNGIALTADPAGQSGARGNRLILSQHDLDGNLRTAQTTSLAVRNKQTGVAGDSFFNLTEPDNGYLSVSSDLPLAGMQAVLYGSDLMQGGNLIPAETMTADLLFPYFVRTGGWKTYFGIINAGDLDEEIRLLSYGENGQLTGEQYLELAAGQKAEYDTASLTMLTTEARSLRVHTTSGRAALVGYTLFWNPTFGAVGRALVPMPLTSARVLEIPHVVQEDGWWAGLAAMNAASQPVTVTLEGFDAQGSLVATAVENLLAYQQLVGLPRASFGVPDADRIVRVRLTASQENALCGYMLFGTADGFQLAGTALMPSYPNTLLCVPHTPSSDYWWTGLALTNTGDQDEDVTYSLYDQVGNLLGSVVQPLAAGARKLSFVSDLFGQPIAAGGHYLVIEAANGQPLNGLYLIGAKSGRQLTGDVMIPLR